MIATSAIHPYTHGAAPLFPTFFVATVGGSIELGAFDKIARSIELRRSIPFQH